MAIDNNMEIGGRVKRFRKKALTKILAKTLALLLLGIDNKVHQPPTGLGLIRETSIYEAQAWRSLAVGPSF
jgi:hypothetical protein